MGPQPVISPSDMQVPLVKSMQAQDLSTVWKMCTKCGKQILACVRDPECKAALDCLTSCASNDQVRFTFTVIITCCVCRFVSEHCMQCMLATFFMKRS